MMYSYVFMALQRGAPARQAFGKRLAGRRDFLHGLGGEILAYFAPQIGWEAAEAGVLIRWKDKPDNEALAGLFNCPEVTGHLGFELTATLRPAEADQLIPGGIYVHRWFDVAPADVDEFLRLSGEGWKDFEPRFDAKVFGLFLASALGENGNRRLLLLTRYADHGVWQQSRDPSTEAMQTFARRAQITQRSAASSTLLTPF